MEARKRGGQGALLILTLFLSASGALRVGSGLGVALANSPAQPSPTEPQACAEPPAALAEAFNTREAGLVAREAALNDRTAALALANEAINKRMDELAAAEAELKKTLQIADGAAEADLARLTAVYEAMKPADATKLFTEMDPEFAAGFLARMNAGSAAAVLTGMDPGKAYSISVLVAGRNALAPKN